MIASAGPRLICPITGKPCRGWDNPTPKPKRNRKAKNGKVPEWALPIEVLSERNKTPAWERPPSKGRKTIKAGEVAAWIREHPGWVAGRLVSSHPEGIRVVYYSDLNRRAERRFCWSFAVWGREERLAKQANVTIYPTFAEWTEAQRAA